jgi:ATP-dependent Clp endopeptidase proteolytic subunit ClpP
MSRINKDSVDRFYDYDIHIESRTLYMGSVSHDVEDGESGTDGAMAERAVKGLHILDNSAPEGDKPITILMNNLGGDEYHCMAIFDAIKQCKNHVTIIVYGHAMSAGSIILQSADKRVMAVNSRMMIHYGTWGVHDHPKIVYKWAEEGKKIDKWMEGVYLDKIREKKPEYPLSKVKDMCNFDTFLNAHEALELGLIDEILGETNE